MSNKDSQVLCYVILVKECMKLVLKYKENMDHKIEWYQV